MIPILVWQVQHQAPHTVCYKQKNSVIRNCCIGVRGAIKLRSSAQVPSKVRYVCQRGAIIFPLKYLCSNCLINTLFYFLCYRTMFDTSAEQSEICVLKWCIENYSIVQPCNKIIKIIKKCVFQWWHDYLKGYFLHSGGSI